MPLETNDAMQLENTHHNEKPLIDETVTAHMMQVFGEQNKQYIPTQAQVDKILALQEKGMDYTHKERTTWSPKQTIELIVFAIIIITLIGIFTLTLFYAKEYLGEVISGMVGLLAGGAGGYGYGRSHAKNSNTEKE